eukprot:6201265-Pleurochrysis_carterae.AAC.1
MDSEIWDEPRITGLRCCGKQSITHCAAYGAVHFQRGPSLACNQSRPSCTFAFWRLAAATERAAPQGRGGGPHTVRLSFIGMKWVLIHAHISLKPYLHSTLPCFRKQQSYNPSREFDPVSHTILLGDKPTVRAYKVILRFNFQDQGFNVQA